MKFNSRTKVCLASALAVVTFGCGGGGSNSGSNSGGTISGGGASPIYANAITLQNGQTGQINATVSGSSVSGTLTLQNVFHAGHLVVQGRAALPALPAGTYTFTGTYNSQIGGATVSAMIGGNAVQVSVTFPKGSAPGSVTVTDNGSTYTGVLTDPATGGAPDGIAANFAGVYAISYQGNDSGGAFSGVGDLIVKGDGTVLLADATGASAGSGAAISASGQAVLTTVGFTGADKNETVNLTGQFQSGANGSGSFTTSRNGIGTWKVIAQSAALAGTYREVSVNEADGDTLSCPGTVDLGGGESDACGSGDTVTLGSNGTISGNGNAFNTFSGTYSVSRNVVTLNVTAGQASFTDTFAYVLDGNTLRTFRLTTTAPHNVLNTLTNYARQ